jgi:hypothetical protein
LYLFNFFLRNWTEFYIQKSERDLLIYLYYFSINTFKKSGFFIFLLMGLRIIKILKSDFVHKLSTWKKKCIFLYQSTWSQYICLVVCKENDKYYILRFLLWKCSPLKSLREVILSRFWVNEVTKMVIWWKHPKYKNKKLNSSCVKF